MGRNFSPSSDFIDLGDIVTARFLQLTPWSMLAFFRIRNSATDDRLIVTKFGSASNQNQFMLRTDKQAAPTNMEVWANDQLRLTGGDNIALNMWYMVAVTNDGLGENDSMTLYLVDMPGTFLDDGIIGRHGGDDADITSPIHIGRQVTGSDPMDGDIANVAYVDTDLTREEVSAYRWQPHLMVAKWKSEYGVQFSMRLGIANPETDSSGSGVTGTVTGTTIGDNPPVGLWYGFDEPRQILSAAGPPTLGIATETDTALPATAVSLPPIGIAAEADTALAATAESRLGITTEADTALPATAVSVPPLGITAEADTALAATAESRLGITAESDTALSATAVSRIGIAAEADTALVATAETSLSFATETDTALLALAGLGVAKETDLALEAGRILKFATETDVALAIGAGFPVGLTTEMDVAFPVTAAGSVGFATEADTGLSATAISRTGIATEADTALLARAETSPGFAIETDVALSATAATSLGVATEVDTALRATAVSELGTATETDATFALSTQLPVGRTSESDTALAATAASRIGIAQELDVVLELIPILGIAVESDIALPATVPKFSFGDQVATLDYDVKDCRFSQNDETLFMRGSVVDVVFVAQRWSFVNCSFERRATVISPRYSLGCEADLTLGPGIDLTFDHCTDVYDPTDGSGVAGHAIDNSFPWPAYKNVTFKRSIIGYGDGGVKASGTDVGPDSLAVTFDNLDWDQMLWVSGDSTNNSTFWSLFPSFHELLWGDVGFVNPLPVDNPLADWSLQPSSDYAAGQVHGGDDGKDLGCDYTQLNSALSNVETGQRV